MQSGPVQIYDRPQRRAANRTVLWALVLMVLLAVIDFAIASL
jgi:hypothetical protein